MNFSCGFTSALFVFLPSGANKEAFISPQRRRVRRAGLYNGAPTAVNLSGLLFFLYGNLNPISIDEKMQPLGIGLQVNGVTAPYRVLRRQAGHQFHAA
jgi:hypothetical protein